MSPRGLPDLAGVAVGTDARIVFPFEGAGPFFVLPRSIELDAEGVEPSFALRLIRSTVAAGPYGVVEMRLAATTPLLAGLEVARSVRADATAAELPVAGGWLHLRPLGVPGGESVVEPLLRSDRGPMTATWTVSATTATLLRESVRQNILPFEGWVELLYDAVTPRVTCGAVVELSSVLAAIALTPTGQFARERLVEFFRQPGSAKLSAALAPQQREPSAQALTDWFSERFCEPVASAALPPEPTLKLRDPLPAGRAEWDLSQPRVVRRVFPLPLDGARSNAELSRAQIIEVTSDALDTGFARINVRSSGVERLVGVEAVGVTLRVPPNPPHRPAALAKTVQFTAASTAEDVRFRLAPGEPVRYVHRTFVIFGSAAGHARADGADVESSDTSLRLAGDDFACTFVEISAAATLTRVARVHAECRLGEAAVLAVELDTARPAATFALPKESSGSLTLRFADLESEESVVLGPLPARSMRLDLSSLPSFGPHAITVELLGTSSDDTLVVELSRQPDATGEKLALRPATPVVWTYFAESPFRAGYRFRRIGPTGAAAGEWSPVRRFDQPLQLTPDGTAAA